MTGYYFIWLLVGFSISLASTESKLEETESDVVLLHILFRHGERTPDNPEELYPNDPYLNESYFPYGWGQLTNQGKRTEYKLGATLRERYDSFLGNIYYPKAVDALSTDYNRTKASLLLVLAALYPPEGVETWDSALNWQPIPYNYYPRTNDLILLGKECPRYKTLYAQLIQSQQMQDVFAKYRPLFKYITKYSGRNITTFEDVYNMGFGFSTEELWGFTLPSWTKLIWPTKVLDLSIKQYYVYMATKELRKIAVGYLMQKIIDDTKELIDSSVVNGTKIHLYSAHEDNIAQLLILLDVFNNEYPDYGSFVTLEVHKLNDTLGIKVLFDNRQSSGPESLKIPSCEEICPLDKVVALVQEYLPEGNLCGNDEVK